MLDDPNNKPDSEEDATATSAAGDSREAKERTFSQAEVDAIAAKRAAKAEKATERRLRSEFEAAQKKEAPPASGNEDLAAKFAALEAKHAWTEALTELDWKPSKEDAEMLRDAFKAGGAAAMHRFAARIKPQTTEAKHVDTPAPKYRDPGAPSGAPPEALERDAVRWSRDHVERLVQNGTLTKELEVFRGTLPGGGGGLFKKRIP